MCSRKYVTCVRAEFARASTLGVSYLVPAAARTTTPLALAVQRHLGVIRRRPVRIWVCARGRLESHGGGAKTVWHEYAPAYTHEHPDTYVRTYMLSVYVHACSHAQERTGTHKQAQARTGTHRHAQARMHSRTQGVQAEPWEASDLRHALRTARTTHPRPRRPTSRLGHAAAESRSCCAR